MNLTSGFSASLDGPQWLKAIRSDAATDIETLPMPTTEEELWRYSRVNEISLEHLTPAPPTKQVPERLAALPMVLGEPAAYVVIVNGALVETSTSQGVSVRSADQFDDTQGIATDIDAFVRLNTAFGPEPVFIDIAPGAVVARPIVVANYVESTEAITFPRVVVRAGEASQATIVEYLASNDVSGLVDCVTEISVAQAANIEYVSVQELSDKMNQVWLQRSVVERDATFTSTTFSLGGSYARTRTDSKLVGLGASSKLRAVYVGEQHQMHDFRTLQDHQAPKTNSDLLFKGVVGDRARSVYSGLIRVEKGAAGTNAYQTNRNLVVSPHAHADSVPNLEIEENDVKCSHASAVGPVDEEQRYYLESRGVPSDVAERLVISGFLHEVIEEVSDDKLKAMLSELVAQKLNAVAAPTAPQ